MTILLEKRYLCACCKKKQIIHRVIERTYEGSVPDVSNCDFSKYSDPRVVGGKLLKNRPDTATITKFDDFIDNIARKLQKNKKKAPKSSAKPRTPKPPIGGICTDCLEKEPVKSLAKLGGIAFEDKPGTFRRY